MQEWRRQAGVLAWAGAALIAALAVGGGVALGAFIGMLI
jgi:hypothetical protein